MAVTEIQALYELDKQALSPSDDCRAVYNSGNLNILCITVFDSLGNELDYEAKMAVESLNPMIFQIIEAKPK
jgi:hypothetical protein